MIELPTGFSIQAIPHAQFRLMRESGRDGEGNTMRISTTDEPGAPLRCCLREAMAGERIALVAYRPFNVKGPYAELGPIFIHADDCPGYDSPGSYPQGFRHRRQVFRPYDAEGNMLYDGIEVIDGANAEQAISRIFLRSDVDFIHSRNLLAGCYMFTIVRRDN